MSASGVSPLPTLIVGGGMITHDQILPSIYHLAAARRRRADQDSAR